MSKRPDGSATIFRDFFVWSVMTARGSTGAIQLSQDRKGHAITGKSKRSRDCIEQSGLRRGTRTRRSAVLRPEVRRQMGNSQWLFHRAARRSGALEAGLRTSSHVHRVRQISQRRRRRRHREGRSTRVGLQTRHLPWSEWRKRPVRSRVQSQLTKHGLERSYLLFTAHQNNYHFSLPNRDTSAWHCCAFSSAWLIAVLDTLRMSFNGVAPSMVPSSLLLIAS